MNTHTPGAPDLPEISDETIARLEAEVFGEIGNARAQTRARSVRRGRIWLGAGAAASIVVVAALIAPAVLTGIQGGAGPARDEAGLSPAVAPEMGVADTDAGGASDTGQLTDPSGAKGEESAASSADASSREIIASGSITITVDDVDASAKEVADQAEALGGYVESMNIGSSGPQSADGGATTDMIYPPVDPTGGWVQIRVPADSLAEAMDAISALGTVTSSIVSRQDVTEQAVDLRARISSAEASVARLTELISQTGSVADLIAAETALSERQAMLESYQQQLESLEGQVDMSSLSVNLIPDVEVIEANPAGFGDGLAAGWNGLVATLNGIVVALGFLIPWIVVVAVIGLIVWGVVRVVRRRQAGTSSAATGSARSGDGE